MTSFVLAVLKKAEFVLCVDFLFVMCRKAYR